MIYYAKLSSWTQRTESAEPRLPLQAKGNTVIDVIDSHADVPIPTEDEDHISPSTDASKTPDTRVRNPEAGK